MKKLLLLLSVFAMLLLQGCYVHGHIGGDDRDHDRITTTTIHDDRH